MGFLSSIRGKLLVLSAIILMTFFTFASFYASRLSVVEEKTRVSQLLERQVSALVELFRGINETLLTSGTPYSIAIATAAIDDFDEYAQQLLAAGGSALDQTRYRNEILNKWESLRASTAQFLLENNVSPDDDDLMIAYGQFLYDGEQLLAGTRDLFSEIDAKRLEYSNDLQYLLVYVLTGSFVLLAAFFTYLHVKLTRPLYGTSRKLMTLSQSGEELPVQFERQIRDFSGIDQAQIKNEIDALDYALWHMAQQTKLYFERRRETEAQIMALNAELEDRVVERTAELEVAVENNERLLVSVGEGIFGLDTEENITFINPVACELLGIEAEQALGQNYLAVTQACRDDTVPVVAEQSPVKQILNGAFGERISGTGHFVSQLTDKLFPIEFTASPIEGTETIVGAVVVFQNIEDRLKAAEERQLAASIYNESRFGIFVTNPEGQIISVNDAFTKITGYEAHEAVGSSPEFLRSGRIPESFYEQLEHTLSEQGVWVGELWSQRKSGDAYPESRTISAVKNDKNEIIRYVHEFIDIADKKHSEEQIYRLMNYDTLTDLPNRNLIRELFLRSSSALDDGNRTAALLSLDLDGLKLVNEAEGIAAGDSVLNEVAARLTLSVERGDLVSRFNGDQFTLCLMHPENEASVWKTTAKILKAVAQPIFLNEQSFTITCSIGVAFYPKHANDFDMLVQCATAAMNEAKLLGRNRYLEYSHDLTSLAKGRLDTEIALRESMETFEGFELYYQPKLNLSTGQLAGAEALIRWNHPRLGFVRPDQFISIAEHTGLIIPLGRWIFERAFSDLKEIRSEISNLDSISVNLSARQFQDERLLETLKDLLERYEMPASLIDIELTESSVMENPDSGRATLQDIKRMGFSISIDDFGVAYSSLSYLKNLPARRLKIDRSFIMDIESTPEDQAITRSIAEMGHNLNLTVLAEGVETPEQMELLKQLGCDEIQGYWFSRPLPLADFKEFIRARQEH